MHHLLDNFRLAEISFHFTWKKKKCECDLNFHAVVFILTAASRLRFGDCRKSKGKGLDNSYSAAYMNQTRDQHRFTVSGVAADWREPMVPQRIMWPSTFRANGQLDPRCS